MKRKWTFAFLCGLLIVGVVILTQVDSDAAPTSRLTASAPGFCNKPVAPLVLTLAG